MPMPMPISANTWATLLQLQEQGNKHCYNLRCDATEPTWPSGSKRRWRKVVCSTMELTWLEAPVSTNYTRMAMHALLHR